MTSFYRNFILNVGDLLCDFLVKHTLCGRFETLGEQMLVLVLV